MLRKIFKNNRKSRETADVLDPIVSADRYNKLGDWQQAAYHYREALKSNSERPEIWVQLGHMEKERGLLDEARQAYEAAIARRPDDLDARIHLAHVVRKQGDLLRAYSILKDIYELKADPAVEAELRRLIGTSKSYPDFMAAVRKSFDANAYLANNPDVAESGANPEHHYVLFGWKERRRANASAIDLSGNPFRKPNANLTPRIALSVVMPTFNRAATLAKTLERLIEIVRDDPVEIIVVDDGSTDGTPDILATLSFRHKQLSYVSVKNSGPGQARNIGATRSLGEIILFVGDDTPPTNADLFRAHYQAHQVNTELGHTVLGKIVWPDDKASMPNAVMSLIQGDGQQQFGYKFMKPWQKYPPWLFYTANVSVKRNIVSDWMTEGFDGDFTLYGFEDSEFAYRMSKKYDDFGVFYTANAVVEHHHTYNTEGFIRRQVACGMMIDVLIKKHPELETLVIGHELAKILKTSYNPSEPAAPTHHYSTMVEGIRAWALVIDHHHGLGSQNWHNDFLNAVFRLSLLDSYLMLRRENPTAQAAGYRYLLSDFRSQIGRAISTELLGELASIDLL